MTGLGNDAALAAPPAFAATSVPDPAITTAAPLTRRHIILFSDGTGNSSAKLFKTNVWRMYEALDLGPAAADREQQLAYYDNGVGTSAFQPLAILGGVFGFGLKRNILDIYRFACRNYRISNDQGGGDRIYGFGFSRGAFTMRLVIALIASQGLVASTSEEELRRLSEDAYRCFRREFKPRRLQWPTLAFRAARDRIITTWRTWRKIPLYDPNKNHHPEIRFVGVWDTVAAYGGPIAEIIRAIDNWFYALSMPDYKLSNKVRQAAHALSIDDERDAFHPLVWDELHEEDETKDGKIAPGRLKQVWFAGMHADVGGGYPDESLSYVSLLWMIHEAQSCGLRTLEVITDRYRALANSAGPIHDSRSGTGGYYRYQPRKIAAWMTTADPGSLYQRDPDNVLKDGSPRGYLRDIFVHESVAARIAGGTDRYAPITLPARIQIAPPEQGGETVPQADNLAPNTPSGSGEAAAPMIDPALRRRFEDPRGGDERVLAMEAVWDLVWWHRIVYFTTLFATAALVLLPLWVRRVPDPPVLADGRTWIGEIVRGIGRFLPNFLEGWIEKVAAHSFYFVVLALLIFALMRVSAALELTLRDRTRSIWADTLARIPTANDAAVGAPAPRLRTARAYQRLMQSAKWTLLPGLIGALMLAALLWLAAGLVTQVRLPTFESDGTLCASPGPVAPLVAVRLDFEPSRTCVPAKRSVTRNHRYALDLTIGEAWSDGKTAATPVGLAADELPRGVGYLGVPLRRVVNAGYLQPAYLIRSPRLWWQLRGSIFIAPLYFARDPGSGIWRATFKAPRDGELFLFANDAVPPFGQVDRFYRGGRGANAGSATITITSDGD